MEQKINLNSLDIHSNFCLLLKNKKSKILKIDGHDDIEIYSSQIGSYAIHKDAKSFFMSKARTDPVTIHAIKEVIHADDNRSLICFFNDKSYDHQDFFSKIKAKNPVLRVCHDLSLYSIQHHNKFSLILKLFAEKSKYKNPFDEIDVFEKDAFRIGCLDLKEFRKWIQKWINDGVIEIAHTDSWFNEDVLTYKITPQGWVEIDKTINASDSRKAFIAMQFQLPNHLPTRHEIQASIEEACLETGWEATTIDQDEFNGGIVDEIMAKINNSRFVIADFTCLNNGVHWEAGYAVGLGKIVILSIHETDVEKLHFDTRHLNYIIWKNPTDLKEKLKNRIQALIR
ncbi:MAG: hypothetical protein K2X39_01930 [Silvanigrellaceae bacterium]|nr:hypothetical protein [Silvanigrellaceae bacterium]